MKKKKILVFEAYPVFSGAQRVSLNLCKVLKENEYDTTLLIADDSNNSISSNFKQHVDNIVLLNTSDRLMMYGNAEKWFTPLHFIKSFLFGLLPLYWQCIKFLFKEKFDVIYFCDPRGAVMILFPAILFRSKKIMYLQSKNKLNPLLSKFLFLTFTDYVVCPSIDVLNSLPESNKKKVINYGIDFTQYSHIDSQKIQSEIELLIPKEQVSRTRFLFAGLIKPQKGVHHLIYALNNLKDKVSSEDFPITFIVGIAKTPAEIVYRTQLINFTKENKIDQYIYWIGWRDDVLSWMKSVDYFIFPTINKEECNFEGFDRIIESTEGSPVVLIESSLCETYTIASKVTGVADTITENMNGNTYNPDNTTELTDCLYSVLTEKKRFKGFPNREQFSPTTFANKFLSLINE
ncbi:glycosyltransferase [Arcicella rigui]|uniref:Glycosyltransferase n=1 Tax=Arcicella rigui TaxID=797020 RepID=A0ABU5Q965_9BACT|nr:glycosyltransferase [Arcicella rigui]MEA5139283.1 glycosyltransferase [Arcicella rigui]